MLLPRPEELAEEEDDPRQELVQQLDASSSRKRPCSWSGKRKATDRLPLARGTAGAARSDPAAATGKWSCGTWSVRSAG